MAVAPFVLLLVPLVYLAGALTTAVESPRSLRLAWRVAMATAGSASLLAIVAAMTLVFMGPLVLRLPAADAAMVSLRLDALSVVMLLLVTTVAGIIVRFARRYLDGDAGQLRFLRWFFVTVSAATLLVITNNMLVLAAAWTASTLALHQLLTFYVDRPQAQIAAHKKFLLSRVADVTIFSAVALLWRSFGTLEIDSMLDRAATLPLANSVSIAGVLLVLGVSLRSAQLPFHGWLIQVMEAPTPVSALLHAGIVNIGGFVLIRLAPLLVQIQAVQLLLVLIGTTTAVVAALVMSTRVSIKVMLAWSTAAQMGFMLLECGLGAYSLALLHLIAHSLYKAHAFLSSGRVVEQQTRRAMAPAVAPAGVLAWASSAALGALLVAAILLIPGMRAAADARLIPAALILALAVAPLFARAGAPGRLSRVATIGVAIGVIALYVGLHTLFEGLLAPIATNGAVRWLPIVMVSTGFAALFITQVIIATYPHGSIARALFPACFAGLYLDEVFTRLTFRLWPPRSTAVAATRSRESTTSAMEIAA